MNTGNGPVLAKRFDHRIEELNRASGLRDELTKELLDFRARRENMIADMDYEIQSREDTVNSLDGHISNLQTAIDPPPSPGDRIIR